LDAAAARRAREARFEVLFDEEDFARSEDVRDDEEEAPAQFSLEGSVEDQWSCLGPFDRYIPQITVHIEEECVRLIGLNENDVAALGLERDPVFFALEVMSAVERPNLSALKGGTDVGTGTAVSALGKQLFRGTNVGSRRFARADLCETGKRNAEEWY
jgi:hypothetical protein